MLWVFKLPPRTVYSVLLYLLYNLQNIFFFGFGQFGSSKFPVHKSTAIQLVAFKRRNLLCFKGSFLDYRLEFRALQV